MSAEEELARVLPVLEGLRGKIRIPFRSIRKGDGGRSGNRGGRGDINDVSAFRTDPALGRSGSPETRCADC